MKKNLIAILGVIVLAGGSYTVSKVISKKGNNKNSSIVRLENGQELRINTSKKSISNKGKENFNREDEQPDIIGQIKSINTNSIIIEQFDMSNMSSNRGGKKLSDGQVPSEKPTPTVSREVVIILQGETSYVKRSQRGMRSGSQNENKNSEAEKISKNDLEEGDVVSVWILDDKIAERIMVR